MLACAEAKVTARSAWAPAGYEHPEEARLEEWGPTWFGQQGTWDELSRWWLAAPRGANTPNWDLAVSAELEGRQGLILVEAKANVPELSRAGKTEPGSSAGSRANHERIGEAIREANDRLRSIAPELRMAHNCSYQLSNRLAFTWKLASLGIPVALLYLAFTGDDGIRDVGEPLRDAQHWDAVFRAHLTAIGGDRLLGRRHQLEGAPFWILSGARPALRQSPLAPGRS